MKTAKYIIIGLFGLIALFPFLWLLSTSFKGAEEIFAYPPRLIPGSFELGNYSGVWSAVPFGKYLFNSVVIAVFTCLLNLTTASLAGYALAHLEFKGKEMLFLLIPASMMIPKELIIIPVYISVLKMHIADTLAGVIIPFAVEGYAIFMMRQAFLAVPKELSEAAIMDGCTPLKLWFKVMLPLTKPTLAVLGLFTFIGSWGDFLWPLVVLKSESNYTLQVGLSYMMGTFVNNFRYVAAGSILALLPVMLLFLFSQKYMIKGLLSGSGK
jgi:putative chitobiose transport system permease protein